MLTNEKADQATVSGSVVASVTIQPPVTHLITMLAYHIWVISPIF